MLFAFRQTLARGGVGARGEGAPRRAGSAAAQAIPRLYFLTDRRRIGHPEDVAARLPRGAAVILRDYDAPDRAALAGRLGSLCAARGLHLLVGADWRLATQVRAAGVHLPEALAARAAGLRRRRPDWLITAAAHSYPAIVAADRAGAHAVLVSPAFPTESHPGAPALGPVRLAALSRVAAKVVALGGVTGETARRLSGARLWGVAAIGAWR